jgi:hypothetical protein
MVERVPISRPDSLFDDGAMTQAEYASRKKVSGPLPGRTVAADARNQVLVMKMMESVRLPDT